MSLRNRLWIVLATLVLLPLVVGGALAAALVPARLEAAAWRTTDVAVASASAALGNACATLGDAGRSAGTAVGLGQTPSAALAAVVTTRSVDYAAILDAEGRPRSQAGSPVPGALTAATCSSGRGGGPALVERVVLRIANQPQLATVVVARVLGPDDLTSLRAGLDPRSDIVLGDAGVVVASSTGPERSKALVGAAEQATGPHARGPGVLLSVKAAAPGVPYTVVVSTPQPDRGRLLLAIGVITVGGVLLALLIGRRLARSLTESLDDVTAAAESVASGNLETRLRVSGDDEVGRLARAFNEMTSELATQRAEVERSHDEVRSGLERMETMLQSTHDLERLLDVVLATAVAATRARAGLVCAVEPDGGLTVAAAHGLSEAERTARGLRVGEGIVGRVAEGGVAVGKIGTTADLLPVAGEPAARFVLGVPIRRSGRVIGVLAVYDRHDLRSGTTVAFGRDQEREVRSIAGSASAAFENVILHQEAQRLSITDPLTGLGNYRLLSTTLSREIERSQRFSRPLSVLMLDIDHFKAVNDRYGHARGDAVLRELSTRLAEELREVDLLARYGGEEFAVILPETGEQGAIALALRIGYALRSRPFTEGGEPITVTASVGVAVMNRDRSTPALLMRAADTALYEAKNGGRDTWAIAVAGFRAVAGDPPRLAASPSSQVGARAAEAAARAAAATRDGEPSGN